MALDLDRGVTMKTHPDGTRVAMYKDTPGVYLDMAGNPVTRKRAEEAGFDVSKESQVADPNHLFQVRIFLMENIRIVVGSAIVIWIGMMVFWATESPTDGIGISTLPLMSGFLGFVLGQRAYQSRAAQPMRLAFGVTWRLGLVWVMVAALAECVTGDASVTINVSPLLLVIVMIILASGFVLGYLVKTFLGNASLALRFNLAALIPTRYLTPMIIIGVLGLVLNAIGIAIALYFGITQSAAFKAILTNITPS